MGKSVARYDGSSAHYVFSWTIVGLYHYQYSRHAIIKPNAFGEYTSDGYHDSDDKRDGYRYSDGLTFGRNGYLVSQCNYDLWNTYVGRYLQLFDSLNRRLWQCVCDGNDYGICLSRCYYYLQQSYL